ncbi:MAG: DsbC family protein [Gammaproteobacteria bacterium]|nr:DsbC family protein [Gammaproteobacteria bacterium]MDP2140516.1 DsbC family protein [Gammaproteobacteria bacterium]MDP2348825.1 DsbC family protein [Gammaproteobacteria bacterium]
MTTLFRSVALVALIMVGLAYAVFGQQEITPANSVQANTEWADALRAKLTTTLSIATNNAVQIISISETPFSGLVEVELSSGETLFSDRNGEYLVTGDLFSTSATGLVNLSAASRQLKIVGWIAAVPEDQMIIFSPEETKATITVFTDVDCTYCRKLHGDLEAIMALGIRVRYLAYPRGGEASTAYPKMISVWCSEDRSRSLTQAKNGQNLPTRDCENHILEHYNLGNKIGISGTPALVLANGAVIPGYLDSQQLAGIVFGQ